MLVGERSESEGPLSRDYTHTRIIYQRYAHPPSLPLQVSRGPRVCATAPRPSPVRARSRGQKNAISMLDQVISRDFPNNRRVRRKRLPMRRGCAALLLYLSLSPHLSSDSFSQLFTRSAHGPFQPCVTCAGICTYNYACIHA